MSEFRPMRGKILAFLFVVLIIVPSSVILMRKVQADIFKAEVTVMQKKIEAMKMKTMCVGRFLIDVPEDAEVSFRGAFLSGWNIVSYPDESDAQFAVRLQKQEEKLKGEKNGKGLASLESVTTIDNDELHGKIFIFGRVWTSGFDGRDTLSWVNVAVKGFVRIGGISFNLTSDDRAPESANDLAQLVTQLKPLAEGEIPRQPGFCFERGILVDPLPADDGESVTMFVGLKDHRDLSIALHVAAGYSPEQTLLERDDANDIKQKYRSHFHTFRQGERTINGIAGQEFLERVKEFNGVILQSFMLESLKNNKDSVLTPFISFEMSTGHGRPGAPVNSSFSDAEAVALWDKISASLRLRPTKVAQPAAAAPLIQPLGVAVSANQACPASGWWRCDDGDGFAVLGGDTQYFRVGERVPQAVLLGPPTLWQRIRGGRHRFQRSAETRWKLVERRHHGRAMSARTPVATPAQTDSRNDPIPVSGAGDDDGELVRAPVGTLAGTGQPCPESGWWICPEAGALDGARWFAQGEVLPSVRIKASRTWLERFMGDPAAHRIRSVWQLARHDAGPPSVAAASGGADSEPAISSHKSDDGADSAHPASGHPDRET